MSVNYKVPDINIFDLNQKIGPGKRSRFLVLTTRSAAAKQ